MKIKDAETGKEQWIDSSSAGVRAAYKEWWEKRQAKMSDTFKKCRVDSVSVRTEDEDVYKRQAYQRPDVEDDAPQYHEGRDV